MIAARIRSRISVAERKIENMGSEGNRVIVFGEATLSDSEWCERLRRKRQQVSEGTKIIGIRFVRPAAADCTWPGPIHEKR